MNKTFLLCLASGFLGVAIHACVTNGAFAKDTPSKVTQQPTSAATTHKSLNSRYSTETIKTPQGDQQMLFDREAQVQCLRPISAQNSQIQNVPWSCVKL